MTCIALRSFILKPGAPRGVASRTRCYGDLAEWAKKLADAIASLPGGAAAFPGGSPGPQGAPPTGDPIERYLEALRSLSDQMGDGRQEGLKAAGDLFEVIKSVQRNYADISVACGDNLKIDVPIAECASPEPCPRSTYWD